MISVKSPSGVFNYTWTKDNKIATQSVGDKKVVNTYDKAGRLTSKMFGDTVLAKYEYDELDRRVKGQYFDVKWDYSYDQYNQLVGANNSKGDSYAYTYDPIGNRLKAAENGKERSFTYNSLNQISNDGYAYDAWGNMTRTPEAEYKYDLKNRLVEVKKKDGTVVAYSYDPQSQRIGSVVNGSKITEFLMSGMIEYARNDGKAQYHTLGLDLLNSLDRTAAVGSILATNDQRYLYDGNGNVTASVKDGIIADKLAYEPFGKQITGENLQFAFSTKAIDASEMSYYGYRFYDVTAGRWTSRDTMQELGGANLYGFVFSNPVSLYDFKGTSPAACADPRVTILGIKLLNKILIECGVTTCTWAVTEEINKKIEEFKLQCLASMMQCALYTTRTNPSANKPLVIRFPLPSARRLK